MGRSASKGVCRRNCRGKGLKLKTFYQTHVIILSSLLVRRSHMKLKMLGSNPSQHPFFLSFCFVCLFVLCVFFLNIYMLWFNFIFGLNYISFCFKLIITHYHTPKQREIKFKPRIKLNNNIYIFFSLLPSVPFFLLLTLNLCFVRLCD